MVSGPVRVLLFGKDARTDALAASCAKSTHRPELYCYSEFQIPGLLDKCDDRIHIGSLTDIPAMVDYARVVRPDLVIVGPEEPLGAGLVDELEALGLPCFGPRRDLAQVETSKSWTRAIVEKYQLGVNPSYRLVRNASELADAFDHFGDCVIKPDGLTGGKGVRVFGEHFASPADATDYAMDIVRHEGYVLIEERLDGEEFSLMSITDGETTIHCPLVQDHKRAYDDDTGPNTGGMGSYSCADFSLPFLTLAELRAARRTNEAMIAALRSETGRPYRGVLYGGFMATRDGVRLIEYNARFGDPEAMNVLPLLETDFVDVCLAVAHGTLNEVPVRFAAKATVCKYVVPALYPSGKGAGDRVTVAAQAAKTAGLEHYWAAVNRIDGEVVLTGSRAVAFVGIGDSLAEAEQIAEDGAASVSGPVRHRRDIGRAEAVFRRTQHMSTIRAASSAKAS